MGRAVMVIRDQCAAEKAWLKNVVPTGLLGDQLPKRFNRGAPLLLWDAGGDEPL